MNEPSPSDTLIDRLATNLTPVKPVPKLRVWLVCWLLIVVLTCTCAGVLIGLRSDLFPHLSYYLFGGQALAISGVAIFAMFSTFFLSVPGQNCAPIFLLFLLSSIAAWLLILAIEILRLNLPLLHVGPGLTCMERMLLFSGPEWLTLGCFVYKAAPINLRMVGVSIALSGAGVGALCAYVACPSDDLQHLLMWHFVPVLIVGGLGIFLAGLFDWRQRGDQVDQLSS